MQFNQKRETLKMSSHFQKSTNKKNKNKCLFCRLILKNLHLFVKILLLWWFSCVSLFSYFVWFQNNFIKRFLLKTYFIFSFYDLIKHFFWLKYKNFVNFMNVLVGNVDLSWIITHMVYHIVQSKNMLQCINFYLFILVHCSSLSHFKKTIWWGFGYIEIIAATAT